jgi:hypothetical protein
MKRPLDRSRNGPVIGCSQQADRKRPLPLMLPHIKGATGNGNAGTHVAPVHFDRLGSRHTTFKKWTV